MDRYNLVVVGAGSGGLVAAAGGAGLGARVALVEKSRMGGDCLNSGCVPSKALLRAAKAVQAARETGRFGIRGVPDPGRQQARPVMDYVRSCQARIAPHDSVERFEGLGVEVVRAAARLKSAHQVEAAGRTFWARHIVLATGSRPRVPDIPGLEEAGYLTNENVFSIDALPDSLLVMGGGPIGVELGQAFARLGSKVTIVSSTAHILPREDEDAAASLAMNLRREGVEIVDGSRAKKVERKESRKLVTIESPSDGSRKIAVDEILVAVGRRPNLEGLNLDGVGINYDSKGVRIDARCRTNVPSVWAIGDLSGPYLFTHWACHQARVVVRNTLFPGTRKCDLDNVPWTTFTDPAIAHVGWTEASAREKNVSHRIFKVPFEENDRAVCDGSFEGNFAKVIAGKKGEILGATIVHPHADDLLAELVLARRFGLKLSVLSETIHTYPALSEIARPLGDAYSRTRLTPSVKKTLEKVFAWLRR
jgi:pyruvate/2-oxoglutarate dehydrogenase complex dihydrolipoamide dehydrogenase (E3) component